jgi:YfiR/HmsC-like
VERLVHEDRIGTAGRASLPRGRMARGGVAFWLLAILAILVIVMLADAARTTQAQSEAGEYRVKAAFLFHFVQLVEWPAGTLGNDIDPVTLCIVGEDSFHGDLETTLAGKTLGTRPLRVRHLKVTEDYQGCQVIFVSGHEAPHLGQLLHELKDGPVLTVGESDGFVEQGGMIGFLLVDNKVRFAINVEAAERAKLKISSRLLLLAKTVVGNHG